MCAGRAQSSHASGAAAGPQLRCAQAEILAAQRRYPGVRLLRHDLLSLEHTGEFHEHCSARSQRNPPPLRAACAIDRFHLPLRARTLTSPARSRNILAHTGGRCPDASGKASLRICAGARLQLVQTWADRDMLLGPPFVRVGLGRWPATAAPTTWWPVLTSVANVGTWAKCEKARRAKLVLVRIFMHTHTLSPAAVASVSKLA